MGRVGILLAGWIFWQGSGFACDCSTKTRLELIEQAEVVFIGRVETKIDSLVSYCRIWQGKSEESVVEEIFYRFSVQLLVKGETENQETVQTASTLGGCGLLLEEGDEALICVNQWKLKNPFHAPDSVIVPWEFHTSICDGSTHTEYLTSEEITALNEAYGLAYAHPASCRQIVRLGIICLMVLAGVGAGAYFSFHLLRFSCAS